MSDEENTENTENTENVDRTGNLGDLADAAHVFDQTNGIVDGLEGDADSPEEVDKRTGGEDGVLPAPLPGTQMPGAAGR